MREVFGREVNFGEGRNEKKKNGERPMSARLLEMGPKEHGFVQVHVGQKRRRTWMDLALIEDEPDLYPERM